MLKQYNSQSIMNILTKPNDRYQLEDAQDGNEGENSAKRDQKGQVIKPKWPTSEVGRILTDCEGKEIPIRTFEYDPRKMNFQNKKFK
mmetsp:Transcript_14588/g.14537  ORF Transcript_14588/g.14537 Transcript_14588/m.14537 type:complete len:87 (+) Transcript_14588:12-272(+)